jgi:hypothetical protein
MFVAELITTNDGKGNSRLKRELSKHFGWSGGQKGGVGSPPSKSVPELVTTNNSTARTIRLIDFFINGHSPFEM